MQGLKAKDTGRSEKSELVPHPIMYVLQQPHPSWHQGPVLWNTILPRTGEVQGVGGAELRRYAHLLLCGLVPNRSQNGTGPRPWGQGPLIYFTQNSFLKIIPKFG